MNRKENFQEAVAPVMIVNDSRFGLRQLPKNNESPSVFLYSGLGRGVSGEHQN